VISDDPKSPAFEYFLVQTYTIQSGHNSTSTA
jgi:hypothetical protein